MGEEGGESGDVVGDGCVIVAELLTVDGCCDIVLLLVVGKDPLIWNAAAGIFVVGEFMLTCVAALSDVADFDTSGEVFDFGESGFEFGLIWPSANVGVPLALFEKFLLSIYSDNNNNNDDDDYYYDDDDDDDDDDNDGDDDYDDHPC
uniref:Uncharacterized protein n=1 Tax=Glossina pallidipes TaxID=7398 RepID=A0A1A9ZME7_GLOPL